MTAAHGTGFTARTLDEWCCLRGVKLLLMRRGEPTENGIIESFNERLYGECPTINELFPLIDSKMALRP